MNAEGRWRCVGSSGPWTDITADPATFSLAVVKPDPDVQVCLAVAAQLCRSCGWERLLRLLASMCSASTNMVDRHHR